jgi:hypothetical protein
MISSNYTTQSLTPLKAGIFTPLIPTSIMPKDPSGQTHTGTYGLFDDPDEIATTTAHAENNELHQLEGVIRREERHDRHLDRKEERVDQRLDRKAAKAAKRVAAGKPPKSRIHSFLGNVFGGRDDVADGDEAVRLVAGDTRKERRRGKRAEYTIVKKPKTPEPVYYADDVIPIDSPWLRECGMVKVKSKDVAGCHIIPKISIQKGE